jgi:hypothetical protein
MIPTITAGSSSVPAMAHLRTAESLRCVKQWSLTRLFCSLPICLLVGALFGIQLKALGSGKRWMMHTKPSNPSMKPTAPWRCNFSVLAIDPTRGLSLSS